MRKALACIALIAVLALPHASQADAQTFCDTQRADVINLIGWWSAVYDVSKGTLYAVAEAESGTEHCTAWGTVKTGDGGRSVGSFMLHEGGVYFDANPLLAEYGAAGRYDAEVQVRFTAWYLWKHGNLCPWTAYKRIYGGC